MKKKNKERLCREFKQSLFYGVIFIKNFIYFLFCNTIYLRLNIRGVIMETALVTGANGFIGSHLATRLVNDGYMVYSIHRKKTSKNPEYNQFVNEGKIKVFLGDISNFDTSVLPKVDYIYHIAGKVSVWGKLEDFRKINLGGTKNLLEYAKTCNLKCFTYLSSVAVYGFNGYSNLKEDAEKKPFNNPYGISKLETENYVKEFAVENSFPYVIIRPGNVYGEYDYTSSHEIYTRVQSEKMLISAGGKYESCFVYAGNLVEAILHTSRAENARNNDYNVSDNNDTLKEYLTKVAKEFNVRPKFKNFPKLLAKLTACVVEGVYKIFHIKKAPLITRFSVYQNCENYSFSIDKLKGVGYMPKFTQEQGIKRTVEWIKDLKNENK